MPRSVRKQGCVCNNNRRILFKFTRGLPKIDRRVRSALDSMAPVIQSGQEGRALIASPLHTLHLSLGSAGLYRPWLSPDDRPCHHKFCSSTKVPGLINLGYTWIFKTFLTIAPWKQLNYTTIINKNISNSALEANILKLSLEWHRNISCRSLSWNTKAKLLHFKNTVRRRRRHIRIMSLVLRRTMLEPLHWELKQGERTAPNLKPLWTFLAIFPLPVSNR